MNAELYSYDIFDTIVTRKVATPQGIFSVIQKILNDNTSYADIPQNLKDNYYEIRVSAERKAYSNTRNKNHEEITIYDIYDVIGSEYSLSPTQLTRIIDLEFSTEISYSEGIQDNINKIIDLVSNGCRVILISDMYLPLSIIKKILEKQNTILLTLPIYLSSEVKLRKSTGNLYEFIANKESVAYSSWKHIGDNMKSDVTIPRKLGIQTEHFNGPSLLPHEKYILKRGKKNLASQTFIGTSRIIRYNNKLDTMASFGVSYGSIILYPYVSWVLLDAIGRGINNLYFIARDGYILKEIADVLIREHQYPISSHYIYGSRKTWKIPSLNDDFKKYVSDNSSSLKDIASFFRMDYECFSTYISDIEYYKKDCLSRSEIDDVFRQLESNEMFADELNLVSQDVSNKCQLYCMQEIDFDKESFAFVDLHGTGKSMLELSEVLRGFYSSPLKIYYQTGIYNLNHTLVHPIIWINEKMDAITELFCRALHGQTIDYTLSLDGKMTPVLSSGEVYGIVECGYESYINGVLYHCSSYSHDLSDISLKISDDDFQQLFLIGRDFLKNPDSGTMEILSEIPFSNTTSQQDRNRVFAPSLSLMNILVEYLKNRKIVSTSKIYYSLKRHSFIEGLLGYAITRNILPLIKIIFKYPS